MYLSTSKTLGWVNHCYDRLSHILMAEAKFECDPVQFLRATESSSQTERCHGDGLWNLHTCGWCSAGAARLSKSGNSTKGAFSFSQVTSLSMRTIVQARGPATRLRLQGDSHHPTE